MKILITITLFLTSIITLGQSDTNKVFRLQGVYFETGRAKSTPSHPSLDQLQLMAPNSVTLDTLTQWNGVVLDDMYNETNSCFNLGLSWNIQPHKFHKDISFRLNTSIGIRGGNSFYNNYRYQEVIQSDTTFDNELQALVITDSSHNHYAHVSSNFSQLRFNVEYTFNYSLFTTLEVYAGLGGSIGTYIQHDINSYYYKGQMVQKSLLDSSIIETTYSTPFSLPGENMNFDSFQLYRGMAYSYYIPFGLQWQSGYEHNKFFKHLVFTIDGRYGFNLNSVQHMDNSFKKMRYAGLGVKWKI